MGIVSLVNTKGLSPGALDKRGVGETALVRDPYAPNFEILVRGGRGAQPFALDDTVTKYIEEISFEDNADQFDHLTINFTNQIDDRGGGDILSLMDSKLFAEGHILEVRMGYGRALRTVGAAQIVKKSPTFPSTGSPSFMLEAYDLLHRAAQRRPKGGVSYKGFRDSQIASIIGERNGFDIRISDPRSFAGIRRTVGIFDRVQKKGVSDYVFLKKVAQINGHDLFSRFNPDLKKFSLFFQPGVVKKQKEVFTFVYNEGDVSFLNTLLSFDPTLDAFDQGTDFEIFVVKDREVGGTKVNFINQLTLEANRQIKEETERRFTGGNPGTRAGKQTPSDNGIEVAFKAFGRSFRFPAHKRFRNEFDARRAIEQFIKRQKENFITGSGEIKGNEALQSRQIHNLSGVSEQFSGKYYFNQVKHIMSRTNGYKCSFNCRKVIDDTIVQSPPTLTLSENDKTLERIKKER